MTIIFKVNLYPAETCAFLSVCLSTYNNLRGADWISMKSDMEEFCEKLLSHFTSLDCSVTAVYMQGGTGSTCLCMCSSCHTQTLTQVKRVKLDFVLPKF
jgi:hypothetical protein